MGYQRVFLNNHELLAEMLSYRLAGLPYRTLTNKYIADRTSIKNWCRKFEVAPKAQLSIRFAIVLKAPNPPTKTYKYQHTFDENDNVNTGKTYTRYLIEARKNFIKSLYAEIQ